MSKIPVALVTGATRGIGRAIVDKLSSKGLCCIMVGSSMESFDLMRQKPLSISQDSQWHRGLAIDLAQWPYWTKQTSFSGVHFSGTNETLHKNGKWSLLEMDNGYDLAMLVNCAGIVQASPSVLCGTEQMQRLTNVNLLSAISMCNIASRRMMRSRRHLVRAPCIINISSVLGDPNVDPMPGTSLYSASKAALAQYSRVLSAELSRAGVSVHCISPSLVPGTDMIQNLNSMARSRLEAQFDAEKSHQSPQQIAKHVWDIYASH
ncbi:LANO_0H12948g1_1 [Lachancea nothofagi CBS 11611]|uniref:LANO_0H12948g1_1 n=1 Tax=Lachancea nothofagi CBS 11611 TaxID=1266666 RepID=A0A1G4KMP2_9SACH|nr:LANO_0H12948g1_1 [Lachancea nothofagi CBS 11611]